MCFVLLAVIMKKTFHVGASININFPKQPKLNTSGWITKRAKRATSPGPQAARGPLSVCRLLFSNLIPCKCVWEFAPLKYTNNLF